MVEPSPLSSRVAGLTPTLHADFGRSLRARPSSNEQTRLIGGSQRPPGGVVRVFSGSLRPFYSDLC